MNERFAVTVLLSAVTAMAASPIAMRVEVEPVRAAGDNTTMAVTVQVAPEDRSRVGIDAWIQGELRQQGARIERLARAVDLDEDGRARIEVDWPPGEYELQIEIEGEIRRGTGVWIQRITVPDMGNTAMESPPETTGISEAAAAAAEMTPAGAEPEQGDVESAATSTPDSTEATIAAAAAITATASTAPEPRSSSPDTGDPQPTTQPESEPATESTPGPTTEAIPVAVATTAAASTAPEPRSPSPDTDDPQPTTQPEPEPATDSTPTPSTAAVPVAVATTAAASAAPEPRSPSPETRDPAAPIPASRSTTAPWPIMPGSKDLTVMVTERNRPVIGLGATAFNLKIAGKDTAIQRVGEGKAVPLNLGLAVGVSQASNEVLDNLVRHLEKLALQTTSGGGDISCAAAGVDGAILVPWGATPEDMSTTFSSASARNQVNLSAILNDSIRSFTGRRGRSFLIVFTDGNDTSTKADWKETTSVATTAGIPIFVVGLSDTGFPSRTRSSLVKLANASGGRSYFLANASMLELTLDYVRELIESSYVLQFAAQPGGGAVKVDSENRAWEVHHPSRIP